MLLTYCEKNRLEVGVDEAGRGPLLGRVYTGAVIWPPDVESPLIKDSKRIKKREDLKIAYDFVKANAVAYAFDYATEDEIESENILQATMNSMHRAIEKCNMEPDHILVDGNYFDIYKMIDYTTVKGGDDKYMSIAAASIIAKYERDSYIEELCDKYPELDDRYGIRGNKGYFSAKVHQEGLKKYGYCQFHRKTFRPCLDKELNEVVPLVKKKLTMKKLIKPKITLKSKIKPKLKLKKKI